MLGVRWLQHDGYGLASLQPADRFYIPVDSQDRNSGRRVVLLAGHRRIRIWSQQGRCELWKQPEWGCVDWFTSAQVPGFGQWDTQQLPPLPAVGFSPTSFNGTAILGFAQVHELPRTRQPSLRRAIFSLVFNANCPLTCSFRPATCTRMTSICRLRWNPAIQSLKYNFVKSTCPQGPAVTATFADCVLGQPWTSALLRRLWPARERSAR